MIQRIQTLYLFIALILMDISMAFPMAMYVIGQQEVMFYITGIKPVPAGLEGSVGSVPLTLLLFINLLLIVAPMLLYKRMKLQMQITLLNAVLLLVTQGVIGLYIMHFNALPGVVHHSLSIPLIFPVISAILLYLAYKGIKKDKELLDSMNRIR